MKIFAAGTLGVLISLVVLYLFGIWGAIAILTVYFGLLAIEGN
jgi:hypothetical protein